MILYSNSRQCSLEILIIYYMWKYYTLHKDLVKMMYFSSEHQKKKNPYHSGEALAVNS